MRATGRRIGRIVGQLDDLVTLLQTYYHNEASASGDYDEVTQGLECLLGDTRDALNYAEVVTQRINKRDKQS